MKIHLPPRRACAPLSAIAALAVISLSVGAQTPRSDSAFEWSEKVAEGSRLAIQNLNGNVRVESGDVDRVTVRATKSWRTGDPANVDIEITRYGPERRDILVCARWKRLTLSCGPGSYSVNNDRSNDTRVDFIVTVPRRMHVHAGTVNGSVTIAGVRGDVAGSTVNGNVVVAVRKGTHADVSISSVNGTFENEFALPVRRNVRRGTTRAKLGNGGQMISFSTVNGEMKLVRM